jgi:hypothetical protein
MYRLLLPLLLLFVAAGPLRAQPARDVRDEVLYEMFVRDFTPEGTLRAAQARLSEVRALGATTVWLMPVYPIGEVKRKGTYGSPYSVADYTAVSPDLGTVDDLRAFTDEAHRLGLRVILDWVANHTAWDHAWMQQHPDWYTRDSTGAVVPPVADWSDVADLDFDAPGLRRAMTDAMRFWIERAGVDGFRCDVAEMVPLDFWRTTIAELRGLKPLLMLAEGATPELYAAGFDLTYDWTLYRAMIEVWRGTKAAPDLAAPLLAGSDPLRIRFTTNHDETAWDKPPMFLFNGFRGAMGAFYTVALLPGVPLVYNGQEGGSIIQTGLFEKMPLPAPDPEVRARYEDVLTLRASTTPGPTCSSSSACSPPRPDGPSSACWRSSTCARAWPTCGCPRPCAPATTGPGGSPRCAPKPCWTPPRSTRTKRRRCASARSPCRRCCRSPATRCGPSARSCSARGSRFQRVARSGAVNVYRARVVTGCRGWNGMMISDRTRVCAGAYVPSSKRRRSTSTSLSSRKNLPRSTRARRRPTRSFVSGETKNVRRRTLWPSPASGRARASSTWTVWPSRRVSARWRKR